MPTTWSTTSKNANVIISNFDLTAAADPGGVAFTFIAGRSDTSFTSNRYWEVTMDVMEQNAGNTGTGATNTSTTFANGDYLGKANGFGFYDDGGVQIGAGPYVSQLTAPSQGDVICHAVSPALGKWWMRRNGNFWCDSSTDDPATNTGGFDISAMLTADLCPAYSVIRTGVESQVTGNFTSSTAFTPPSGYPVFDGAAADTLMGQIILAPRRRIHVPQSSFSGELPHDRRPGLRRWPAGGRHPHLLSLPGPGRSQPPAHQGA